MDYNLDRRKYPVYFSSREKVMGDNFGYDVIKRYEKDMKIVGWCLDLLCRHDKDMKF